jgi:peptidoglycan/LPS O-acetylase OafA/YrhL
MAFAAYRARSRFGSLDGLRCLCILAVVWHHGPIWAAETSVSFLTRGFLGVDFFFVLSGFLITTLLLREEAESGRFSLRGFYWRRLVRIVPVYFFVVTLVSAWYILGKGETDYVGLVPWYYLFLVNFLTTGIPLLGPTWSLSVEEQYYLLWPLLLLLLPRRAVLPVLAVLVAVNVLGIMGAFAGIGLQGFNLGPYLHVALPNATYAPILMGSALAVVLNNHRGFAALFPLLGGRLAPLILMFGLLALVSVLPDDLRGLPNLAIHLAMTASLASLVLREDHLLAPVLAWRPVARVGEISYGIYLYHLIGLHLANVLLSRLGLAAPWSILLLYAAISIGIAEISFRSLEAWFLRLRKGPAAFSRPQ